MAGSIIVLGYRFFHFIWQYSVNVLFFDPWDILADRFQGSPTLTQLFLRQQGPPREGVGLAADKSLYALTHWNVRAESFLIGSCIFIAMLLALVLKRNLFGRFAFSDVSIPMMFLTLAGVYCGRQEQGDKELRAEEVRGGSRYYPRWVICN